MHRSPRRDGERRHHPPLPAGPPPSASFRECPPSATLILRGLTPTVDNAMILDALRSFRPLAARIILDKATGESRGFGFVDFADVESATEVTRAFASEPLVLDHRRVAIGYDDSSRRRSPGSETSRPSRSGGDWIGSHRSDIHHEPSEPRPLRLDWICGECNVTNLARRTVCFQCEAPKTAYAKEVSPTAAYLDHRSTYGGSDGGDSISSGGRSEAQAPLPPPLPSDVESWNDRTRHYSENERETPSRMLVVRNLPSDIEEGELNITFAEFEGVRNLRLVSNRSSNEPRSLGLVEFCDAQSAKRALEDCGALYVRDQRVRVSLSRESRPNWSREPDDASGSWTREGKSNSAMETALEQAQWSLANARGASGRRSDQQHQPIDLEADVSALLDSAAAEVTPRFEEPRKRWPPPFETAGGSYVYASEYGLYWDADSLFFYDPQSKVYYSHFLGKYYRCVISSPSDSTMFEPFTPPLPVDNAVYGGVPTRTTVPNGPALSLSLKKDKKKPPAISLGLKSAVFASGSTVFEKDSVVKPASGVAGPGPSSSGTVGVKRKSAEDIAKWSRRQRENKLETGSESTSTQRKHSVASKTSLDAPGIGNVAKPSTATSVVDALTNVAQEAPICLLCRRKFGSLEQLRKHEQLSKLHRDNLAKAKEQKQRLAAQYRVQEHEMQRDLKKQRQQEQRPRPSSPAQPAATVSSTTLEDGIGGKMLKLMGWKSGEGLGKHGTGITEPIRAAGGVGRAGMAGLGSKTPLSASVDLSGITTDKERRQKLARARYEASS